MNPIRSIVLVSALIGLLISACAPTANPAAAPATSPPADPAAVAKAYIAAANTGDFAAASAFYADNAVVKNPLGLFVGKQQINEWLKADVQTTRANPAGYQVNGNTVMVTGTVTLDRFVKLGIDPVAFRSEYLIEDGKIKYFSPAVLLTPAQQDKVKAASPAQPVTTLDLASIPKAYIAAANTGDPDKALAFYADDAVVKNPLGLFVGKQQIGEWLKADVKTTRANPLGYQVVSSNTVIVTGTVSLDRFVKLGIDPVAFRSEYLIENDKIKFFSPTVLLTPEQQAKVAAAAPTPATVK